MRLARLEVGRQRAGTQSRETLRKVVVIEDFGRHPEALHAPLLCVSPLTVAARHPQDPVLVKFRGRIREPGECGPVPVGPYAVAGQQQHLVIGIAHAAYRGRGARGTFADARAFLDNGDAKCGSPRQLPGDGQADDARAGNDDVVTFHASSKPYIFFNTFDWNSRAEQKVTAATTPRMTSMRP